MRLFLLFSFGYVLLWLPCYLPIFKTILDGLT
nr:MAG TPA: hypothetical protein [Bacteriophage sp.]